MVSMLEYIKDNICNQWKLLMKLDKIENIIVAPLYIIILMVTIPVLSETIYTPSLPDLAKDLAISANLAEYTLTIYLFGFAIGVLIWGNLSDCYGRKPCVLTGFLIYALSCFICYLADNINMLFAARFIQAFGASVGSVLGIAIARDVVKPAERGKMFSTNSYCHGVFSCYRTSYRWFCYKILSLVGGISCSDSDCNIYHSVNIS